MASDYKQVSLSLSLSAHTEEKPNTCLVVYESMHRSINQLIISQRYLLVPRPSLRWASVSTGKKCIELAKVANRVDEMELCWLCYVIALQANTLNVAR